MCAAKERRRKREKVRTESAGHATIVSNPATVGEICTSGGGIAATTAAEGRMQDGQGSLRPDRLTDSFLARIRIGRVLPPT